MTVKGRSTAGLTPLATGFVASRGRRTGWAGPVLIVIGATLIAVLGGAAAGLGSLLIVAPFLMIIFAAGMIALPAAWWIWALIGLSMLAVGPLVYFAHLEGARAGVLVLGLTLVVPLLFRAFMHGDGSTHTVPGFIWFGALFLACLVFSTAIAEPRLADFINIVRQYLWYLPLILLLMLGAMGPESLAKVWYALLVIAALQLPVVVYQHFTSAAGREGINALDSVVGLFPGNPEGGGSGAAMAVFVLMMMVFALALWRRGLLRTWQLIGMGLVSVATISFAEVKAVALLFPFALGLVYWRELRRHPLRLVSIVLVGVVAAWGIISFYDYQYTKRSLGTFRVTGQADSAMEAVRGQFDPSRRSNFGDLGNSRMGRYADWYERNVVHGDAFHLIFGHGGGATSISRVGLGKVAAQSPYFVNSTGSNVLLWEAGVLGHALLLLILLTAALAASRLSRDTRVPTLHQALLQASAVALVLHAITLPYRSSIFVTLPSQVILALLLGYVAYWVRTLSAKAVRRPWR